MKTKRFLSVLLTLVMVISLLSSITLTASAEDTSGNCGKNGDNVTWKYNAETKTITFSGIGKISDYTEGKRPWESYMSDIENVIIESGVTEIGQKALYECSSLKSISIPESVEKIRSHAFYKCTGLKEVIIPNGVKSIYTSAFANTGLEKVTIGNDISTIFDMVFYGCQNLKYVIIGGGINSVYDNAFWSCSQLKDVYINCTKAAWEAKSEQPTFNTAYNEASYPTLYFTDYTTMITFDAEGGSCLLPIALVNENKKLSELPIPIKDKCSFDGWYGAKEGGDKITTDTIFTESATIYAHWTTDTQHEIDFEGVCYTEYTIVVKVADYLPADAAITTMSGSLPAVGKKQNITYTSDVSQSSATLYTKICDKPTKDTYTVTVYTSNYGTITITVNISLLGYKINSYDTSAKSASVSFKEAGTHSVIFASYNGSQLSGIDIVDYAVEAGGTFDVSQEDTSFTANKIMLWQDMTGLVPLCDAYIVK